MDFTCVSSSTSTAALASRMGRLAVICVVAWLLFIQGVDAAQYFIVVRPSSEVAEGEDVYLHCEPCLGCPTPTTGYHILRGGQIVHTRNMVGNPYQFKANRRDDSVTYRCGRDDGSVSESTVTFNVDYGPTSVTVAAKRLVADGKRSLDISCQADAVKPSATFFWKVISRKLNRVRNFDGGAATANPDGTWSATLTLTPDPEEHDEVVQCKVENEKYPSISSLGQTRLSFLYPAKMAFSPSDNVTAGTSIEISCGPTESDRPGNVYSLYRGSTLLSAADQVTHTVIASRDDNGAEFKCSAPEDLDSATGTITVLYPPPGKPKIDFSYNYTLIAGGTRTISCSIQGGNPLPDITWTCDKATPTYNVTKEGGATVSHVTVTGPKATSTLTCTCWGSHVTGQYTESDNFTFTVYYGPESVDIQGNRKTRANGKKDLALLCVTSAANPAPTFTWVNASGGGEVIAQDPDRFREDNGWSSTFTFYPERNQDENVIVCDVTNPTIPGFSKISANVTLDLIYPPLEGPRIETPDGTVSYAGRETHALCSVEGGKPLADVTWICDSAASYVVINDASNVARVQLTPPDNVTSVWCRCEASHTMKAYSDSAEVTFEVFSPPGKPTINFQNLTLVEGKDLMVKCSATPPGHPPAEFTIYKEGKSVFSVISPDTFVSMGNATKGDDSVNFECEASNNYTRSYPPSPRSDPMNLTVYGTPLVTFTPGDSVAVGTRVELQCGPQGGGGGGEAYTLTRDGMVLTSRGGQSYPLTVSKEDDGAVFSCSAPGDVATTQATLTVFFGPSSAEILGNVQTLADGNTPLSLICMSDKVKPAPTFTWTNVTSGEVLMGGTPAVPRESGGYFSMVNLRPLPYQDSDVIRCSVSNPRVTNGAPVAAEASLNLTYPPDSMPQVKVLNNTVVYAEERETVECRVSGGKPAASVTWVCDDVIPQVRNRLEGNVAVAEMTLVVPSRTESIICRCQATHRTGKYQQEVSLVMTVYYPPGKPEVAFLPGSTQLEGQSVRATCVSRPPGNPPARYTLFRDDRPLLEFGREGWSPQNIGPVTRQDNGAKFFCEATNHYVSMKQVPPPRSNDLILAVHYGPKMNLSLGSSTRVTEGADLTVECTAESNPPSRLAWQLPGGSGRSPSTRQGGRLELKAVRREDDGVYTCNASVTSLELGLGLANEMSFRLYVDYPPLVRVRQDVLPGQGGIRLVCEGEGRPRHTTYMAWQHTMTGSLVREVEGHRDGGRSILDVGGAGWMEAGRYTCSAHNGVPDLQGHLLQTAYTDVTMKDRPVFENASLLMVKTVKAGEPLVLIARFLAEPTQHNVTWLHGCHVQPNAAPRVTSDLRPSRVQLAVFSRLVWLEGVQTELTFKKVVMEDQGDYCLRVCNEEGCSTARFQISVTAPNTGATVAGIPIAVVAGVAAGAFVIILILIIVCCCCVCKRRRRDKGPKQLPSFASGGMGADFIRKSRDALPEESEPLKGRGGGKNKNKEKIYFEPSEKSPGPDQGGFPLLPTKTSQIRDFHGHPDSDEEVPQSLPEPQDGGRWRDSDGLVYLHMDISRGGKPGGTSTFKPAQATDVEFAPLNQRNGIAPPPAPAPAPSQTIRGVKYTAM